MWHLLHTRICAECFIGICFYNSLVSSTRNILCPVYRQSNYYLQGLDLPQITKLAKQRFKPLSACLTGLGLLQDSYQENVQGLPWWHSG